MWAVSCFRLAHTLLWSADAFYVWLWCRNVIASVEAVRFSPELSYSAMMVAGVAQHQAVQFLLRQVQALSLSTRTPCEDAVPLSSGDCIRTYNVRLSAAVTDVASSEQPIVPPCQHQASESVSICFCHLIMDIRINVDVVSAEFFLCFFVPFCFHCRRPIVDCVLPFCRRKRSCIMVAVFIVGGFRIPTRECECPIRLGISVCHAAETFGSTSSPAS